MTGWLRLLPLASLLVLAPIAVLQLPAGRGHEADGPVYTVAQLQDILAHQRGTWVERIVRVHALAEPCPAWSSPHNPLRCLRPEPVLVDPDGADLADPLPLVVRSESSLLTALRLLPLVSQLAPTSRRLQWEALAIYHVRLRTDLSRACGTPPCYEALLEAADDAQ